MKNHRNQPIFGRLWTSLEAVMEARADIPQPRKVNGLYLLTAHKPLIKITKEISGLANRIWVRWACLIAARFQRKNSRTP